MEEPYNGQPPFVAGSETSEEASRELKGVRGMRKAVYDYLAACDGTGATDEEIQRALKMGGNTERPRRRELEKMGAVVDSGLKRKGASGMRATVWVVGATKGEDEDAQG